MRSKVLSKVLSLARLSEQVTFVLTPLKSRCFSYLRTLFFRSIFNQVILSINSLIAQASPNIHVFFKKNPTQVIKKNFSRKMLPQTKSLASKSKTISWRRDLMVWIWHLSRIKIWIKNILLFLFKDIIFTAYSRDQILFSK